MKLKHRISTTLVASLLPLVSSVALANISIDTVFFAQTHVQEPNYEYFSLVSNRKTLIKAHVLSSDPRDDIPQVEAVVKVNGKKLVIPLSGSATVPEYIESDPCYVEHPSDGSYIGYIPKDMVKPGMTVKIRAGDARKKIEHIDIGAPSVLNMKMFDVFGFEDTGQDFEQGWREEFEAKLPVSQLNVERIKAVFDEVVLIPQPGKSPARRVSSRADTQKTEQTAARWMNALKQAAGTAERNNFYYMNVGNMKMSLGRGGNFGAIGMAGKEGYLLHEAGHGLSLAHCNQGPYPYKKSMCGVTAEKEHIGPVWPYDIRKMKFVSPISDLKGTYRTTPMLGGGEGKEKEYWANTYMKFYSDYEVNKMKRYIEKHMVVWNPALNRYASWNNETKAYTDSVNNDGVQYPVVDKIPVISILSSVSAVTPEANIVYPPIGPYTTGLIRLFDPGNPQDRAAAEQSYCPEDGCDVSLKVLQGGVKKTYMLPISWDPKADPYHKSSLRTRALNVPAQDGEVTKVTMLYTPDAEHNGLPRNKSVITNWKK